MQVMNLRTALDHEPDRLPAALEGFVHHWGEILSGHLQEEERSIVPLVPDPEDARVLLDEHREIRGMAEAVVAGAGSDLDLLRRLAQVLHDHVRWEERHLFPRIEEAAGENALGALGEHMDGIEATRPRYRRKQRRSSDPA